MKEVDIKLYERSVMDVKEAADFLRVSQSIIRQLIKEKDIPYFQIKSRYLFYRQELEKWIIARTNNATCPEENTKTKMVAEDVWKRKDEKK